MAEKGRGNKNVTKDKSKTKNKINNKILKISDEGENNKLNINRLIK